MSNTKPAATAAVPKARKGQKKSSGARKIGRHGRSPSAQAYKLQRRWEVNKKRRVAAHKARMARHAAKLERRNHNTTKPDQRAAA